MTTSERAQRFAAGLRALPRALQEDLWTGTTELRPTAGGSRWQRGLAATVAVLLGAAVIASDGNKYARGYQLGELGYVLAVAQAAMLVVALYRPIPAWWGSTMIQLALLVAWFELADIAGGRMFPWTGSELVLQAWVLFLVALRTRPRTAVETLVIGAVPGLAFAFATGNGDRAPLTGSVLVIATVVGALLRGRQVARTQLVELEELTAEERARRTLLEERNRIARELHDVVAHHMSVISIQAQVAPHLVENPSDELKENLASIRENAKEALTELRQVLGVLRSEHLVPENERHAPQPTLDRMDELVGNVRGAGLTVTTHTTGERGRLTSGIELSAFRIIQEALSNAMRHAPGAEVRVDIDHRPTAVRIRVANTAPDRPTPPSPGAGHGLLGMRERTAMLGGTLAFGATPDGGYEVIAELPAKLPAQQADLVEDTA
ncbi:sensor histidine kinase [Streptomyces sp. ID05-04B]|uniref:sensor histidine kinase n=1 Tax=unclassified Streptomyces TaxID=2593676 RepID=UPI000D1A8824|nr:MULTISPECIES: sensor histidine kinase [unclassified Streptomyces]AVV46632.1 two-component sensor histidine kinase [Streptomyces sp. P3]MDX5569610.1 sensor histidine kinase [Streptomyces sp. ID05-04B]